MVSLEEFLSKPQKAELIVNSKAQKKLPVKSKGKKYEDVLQRGIIRFLRYKGYFVFAIPNGGSRNRIEARNLKISGVVAGVADLCVMLPEGKTVWLEIKRPEIYGISHKTGNRIKLYDCGEQSAGQVEFMNNCRKLGHEYHIVKSIEDVAKIFNISGVWSVNKPVNK